MNNMITGNYIKLNKEERFIIVKLIKNVYDDANYDFETLLVIYNKMNGKQFEKK